MTMETYILCHKETSISFITERDKVDCGILDSHSADISLRKNVHTIAKNIVWIVSNINFVGDGTMSVICCLSAVPIMANN